MWRILLRLAGREFGPRPRLVAIITEGVFFLVVMPALLVVGAQHLDRWFGLPVPTHFHLGRLVGVLLAVAGIPVAIWSVQALFARGRGTPVPVMATQRLVIEGPYVYCRNPMALGIILMYLGLAIWLWSLSALVLVVVFAALLLAYIKLGEEREMELRFGQAYRDYRNHTPFLLPRPRKLC